MSKGVNCIDYNKWAHPRKWIKMKKLIISVFTFALMLIPVQGVQALEGKRCAKIAAIKIYKGNKYICTADGKRKLWKFKEVVKTTPITPKETVPTFPEEKIKDEVATTKEKIVVDPLIDRNGWKTSEEALIIDKLTDIAWEKGTYADTLIGIESHSKVESSNWAKDANAILPAITRILSGAGAPIKTEINWFVWWDLDSLKPKLPTYCWAKYPHAFRADATGAGFCMPRENDPKGAIFIFYEAYQQWYAQDGFLEKYPNIWDEFGITAVAAGEVVHFSQYTYGLDFGKNSFNFYPAWLREGPSMLYSVMAYAKYHNIPYSTARNLALKHFGNYKCGEVELKTLTMFNQSSNFCEYTGGFLASEYMIAKSGDILAPYRFLESKIPGNGNYCPETLGICADSYNSVISEIYSKDVDKWHNDLQEYIRKWGGRVS